MEQQKRNYWRGAMQIEVITLAIVMVAIQVWR